METCCLSGYLSPSTVFLTLTSTFSRGKKISQFKATLFFVKNPLGRDTGLPKEGTQSGDST